MACIVVATDFKDGTVQAVQYAAEWARSQRSQVHLLHVMEEIHMPPVNAETSWAREVRIATQKATYSQFSSLLPYVRGVENELAVRCGRASAQIVAYAQTVGAALIVLAVRDKRRPRLLGFSTLEAVSRKATCPVIAVGQGVRVADGTAEAASRECGCTASVEVRTCMRRDVLRVHPDTLVRDVIDLMIHFDVSGVPVVDEDDMLVGYIAEGSLLVRTLFAVRPDAANPPPVDVESFVNLQRQIHGKTAREVMRDRQEVVTVDESAHLAEAVQTMLAHQVSRLPVVRGNRLVGYLTRADILRQVRMLEDERLEQPLTDEEIATMVRQALECSPQVAPRQLAVDSDHGVVHLHGYVSSAGEALLTSQIVGRLPGVTAVANDLESTGQSAD